MYDTVYMRNWSSGEWLNTGRCDEIFRSTIQEFIVACCERNTIPNPIIPSLYPDNDERSSREGYKIRADYLFSHRSKSWYLAFFVDFTSGQA